MYKYAHGKASIGPIQRPVYFDLGGEYDLIDDMHYDEIIKSIKNGDMRGAEIITPEELGHSSRGVPVDLACSTSASGSSIAWITRWVRVTVEVTTKAGRKFILTQADIGFVRRSTPLLILGKNTCMLCGYRTIKQQDSDRHDEDKARRKSVTKVVSKTAAASTSSATAEAEDASAAPSSAATECTDALQIEVMHEDGKMMLGGQFFQIAASDVPLHWIPEYDVKHDGKFADAQSDTKDHHYHDDRQHKFHILY